MTINAFKILSTIYRYVLASPLAFRGFARKMITYWVWSVKTNLRVILEGGGGGFKKKLKPFYVFCILTADSSLASRSFAPKGNELGLVFFGRYLSKSLQYDDDTWKINIFRKLLCKLHSSSKCKIYFSSTKGQLRKWKILLKTRMTASIKGKLWNGRTNEH